MYNDKKIKDKVIRRVVLLGAIQTAMFALIFGRLYKLQIVENDKYKTQSDENRINLLLHSPIRGDIIDSSGKVLAKNKEVYSLYLIPNLIDNIDKVITELSATIDISQKNKKNFFDKLKTQNKNNIPILLKNYLSWKELSVLSVNKDNIPGINIKSSFIRDYSYGIYYAHIIGYTSVEKRNKNLISEILTGKMGIEKSYNSYLKGVPGSEEIEVNATGRYVRRLSFNESIPGSNIQLTINTTLQKFTKERLKNHVGAAIIMNAENGDIYASVSNPSFDPNLFSKKLEISDWENLIQNKDSPLINRSFGGLYPPGSTFKPVIAMAALKHRVVTKDEKIFCNGIYKLGNRNFHCWKKGGHGTLTLEGAIAESCDVYFYELALRLGIDRIYEMAKNFGFGDYYNDYFGKSNGIIPNKRWKKDVYKENWQKGETLNVGIGQGFLLVTPLELALMTANIANMGKMVNPNIIKSINGQKINNSILVNNKDNINYDHVSIIKKGMFNVVNSPKGTAWKSRVNDDKYVISGKTGTSQVRIISSDEREEGIIKNEDLPRSKRDHALFIGFAPYNKPKFVTVIILEHAGGGSKYAAPVGKDLLVAARKIILGEDTLEKNEA